METSFNGADFEQTNRFQFRLNIIPCHYRRFCASVCTSALSYIRTRLSMVPFPLSRIYLFQAEADFATAPRPLLSRASSRLYRSSMGRVHTSKTAGYSSTSYRQWRVMSGLHTSTVLIWYFRGYDCLKLIPPPLQDSRTVCRFWVRKRTSASALSIFRRRRGH